MSRLRLVVAVAIAVAVVGLGSWSLWPKSEHESAVSATAGPYLVRMTSPSPMVGTTPVTVEISGNEGQPPDSVTFEPAMPQMGHATTPVAATAQGDGRYRADVDLSMAGQWEITVRIAARGQVQQAVLSVTTNG